MRRGALEFFLLDSDPHEPDGNQANSTQGRWLKEALAMPSARWKLVAFHHPPYSTGMHGGSPTIRWPFKACGATAVLSNHDHHYERIRVEAGEDALTIEFFNTGGHRIDRFATVSSLD